VHFTFITAHDPAMTRVTSADSPAPKRGKKAKPISGTGGLNRRKTFKKSGKASRAPLSAVTLNRKRSKSKITQRQSPFQSLQPNKGGVIYRGGDKASNAPSDFSHFLSKDNTPDPNAATESAPKSAANQERDDLISAGLDLFNSMTVPFNDRGGSKPSPAKQTTSTSESLSHQPHSMPPTNQPSTSAEHQQPIRQRKRKFAVDYVPQDWSLKSSLYFVSDSSLDWCCNIPLKIRNAALHRSAFESDSALERRQYTFFKNMVYYQFPDSAWTPQRLSSVHQFYLQNSSELEPLQHAKDKSKQAHFGVLSGTNAPSDENSTKGRRVSEVSYNAFVDRLGAWMQSFHSLYSLFRCRNVDFVYVHFADMFDVLFMTSDDGAPQAIITNTHQSFRNTLRKHNVPFTTPLAAAQKLEDTEKAELVRKANDDGEDEVDAAELEELARNGIKVRVNKKRKAQGLSAGYSNKERTTALISGKRNVHCFFDFLLNHTHRLCLSMKKCHDVPLLLSDRVFLNAQCALVAMSKNLSGFTQSKQEMFTMQLDGKVLPNVCTAIIGLLREAGQNATISAQRMDKMSVGLNYCAQSKLFCALKDEENREFHAINKFEVRAKHKGVTVHLQ